MIHVKMSQPCLLNDGVSAFLWVAWLDCLFAAKQVGVLLALMYPKTEISAFSLHHMSALTAMVRSDLLQETVKINPQLHVEPLLVHTMLCLTILQRQIAKMGSLTSKWILLRCFLKTILPKFQMQ
jgi:hypothetical protein